MHSFLELLAQTNGTADESVENKLLRDKAFTLLLQKKVREFREYVRFVFLNKDELRESI